MRIEPAVIGVDQTNNYVSDYPQFTMQEGFGFGQVNNVSRSNSENNVDNVHNQRRRSHNSDGMGMQDSTQMSDGNNRNPMQQQRRPIDPFDMFVQLKRQQQQNQILQQQMNNNGENSSLNSSMSSFQRVGSALGSFANMGSLSKLSSSDMSLVMSAQDPVNGKNNHSWGNPGMERTHSSLPVMNSGNRNPSMNGMNAGRNFKFSANDAPGFGNVRNNHQGRDMMSNNFMSRSMDDVPSSSYLNGGSPFNNNGGNQKGGNSFSSSSSNNNSSQLMTPTDLSKLSNEQLRQMILMDAVGTNGPKIVSSDSSRSHSRATNISNSSHSASSNPFLKNLGIMNYRNHVMPMSIERHSNKSRRSEEMNMVSVHSDITTSHHSRMTDFNHSNSNFSFHDETGVEEHGTMPDEKESYNAAANGILAPWSARAAGLFGDMMIQSSEDEKAKKASRKKPKDKPKRPLSAYNIFFKEERNRILNDQKQAAEEDGVPTTIAIGKGLDNSTKSHGSADEPIPSESQSSNAEDSKSSDKKKKIGFESLAKLIGRRWQELDEESMAVYKSKASVDMDRYKREMEVWNLKHGNTPSRKRKSSSGASKKTKRGGDMISSSSTHSISSLDNSAALQRSHSTPASLDVSTGSSKQHEMEPNVHNSTFRDLSKARLETDLFRLTEVEEDTNNGIV
eukprot:CAMPEP_0116094126 /NCGR_PEP_ID=MMETSP0327-20121206/8965_1 /TAXON_ID=44447 /ORGANISM="Pseudo-nitzschia delicatissima, Strain B596" /LENGTH=674 /DNA_ID=CAMNT_0003585709 /DNA_START=215 /DNA_END=2239 /DNA_ORIENTATION=-